MPINICPICQEEFNEWPAYHEHLNLMHGVSHKQEPEPIKIELGEIATLLVTLPKDLTAREYKPMNPVEKRRIVVAFEKRLGKAIIGMILALALAAPFALADDDDGKIGPQGPQGVTGPQGPRGNAGQNGADGKAGAQGPQGEAAPSAHFYGGLELNLTLYDGPRMSVGLFNTLYAAPSDWGNVTGVSLSFTIGKSYLEKKLDEQQKEIDALSHNVIDARKEKMYR